MPIESSKKLKVLYGINFAQFSVAPMTFGVIMNIFWGIKYSPNYFGRAVICLLLLVLSGYRLLNVVRNDETLRFVTAGAVAQTFRSFSLFLMWVGVLAIPSLIVVVCASLIFKADWLIAMGFIVPIWIGFAVGTGFIGFILFELARLASKSKTNEV